VTIDPAAAWIALGLACAPDGDRMRAILARHGSPAPLLLDVDDSELLPPAAREAAARALARAERERAAIRALGGEALVFGDPRYPPLLREIADPPAWLAMRGDPGDRDAPGVAIVGSRRASEAGEARARSWAAWLAARGITIVSGFAHGIDAAAHRGAIEAGGRTLAVLGCGLDVLHPRRHRALREEIVAARGAIVSEFPLGRLPATWTFPQRNRVISGVARGVLVIQAAARSGTLITARLAGEQGRDVWAVPGAPEDPRARGTNALLRQGARLVEDPAEVLEDLLPGPPAPARERSETGDAPPDRASARNASGKDRSAASAQASAGLTDEERVLIEGLSRGAVDIDTLSARAGVPAARAAALMLRLEILGHVRKREGMRFERA
jgi:DNA processing protein